MVATAPETSIRDQAMQWMQDAIDDGLKTEEAAAQVWERIKTKRLVAKAAEEFVAVGIIEVWSARNRAHRKTVTETDRRVVNLEGDDFIDSSMLMECLYSVNGRWLALGEMTKQHLVQMSTIHRKHATAHSQRAAFFDLVQQSVEEGKQVRQCLTEEALQSFWKLSQAE